MLTGGAVLREVGERGAFGLAQRPATLMQRVFGAEPSPVPIELARGGVVDLPGVIPSVDALLQVSDSGRFVWTGTRLIRERSQAFIASAAPGDCDVAKIDLAEPFAARVCPGTEVAWGIWDNLLWTCELSSGTTQRWPGLPRALANTSADFDSTTGELAIGLWGAVLRYALREGRLRARGRIDVAGAEVAACLCRSSRLIALVPAAEQNVLGGRLGQGELALDWSVSAALQKPLVGDLSADGRWLALALADGDVCVYDLENEGTPQRLRGHNGAVTCAVFVSGTHGANTLITGDRRGIVVVWPRSETGVVGHVDHLVGPAAHN